MKVITETYLMKVITEREENLSFIRSPMPEGGEP
jgi:hypothetical protein